MTGTRTVDRTRAAFAAPHGDVDEVSVHAVIDGWIAGRVVRAGRPADHR